MNITNIYCKMKIYPIISHSSDSNCYIIEDKKICIIDTGYTKIMLEKIFKILDKLTRNIRNIKKEIFIINTHCHYDHIGNDEKILEKLHKNFNTKIFICEHDKETILNKDGSKILNYLFNEDVPEINEEMINFISDNTLINIGETNLKIISTPGHTYGSISIYEEKTKSLFTGDLIFRDTIGRSDFVDGNFELQKKSIEKILNIDFKNLCPGHGEIGNFMSAQRVYKEFF